MKTPLQIEIVVAPQYLERLHEYIKLVYDRLCNSKHFTFSNFVISSDDEDNQPQDYPKINELIQYLSSINSAIELVSNIKSLKKFSQIKGDCEVDMAPYAASIIRLFTNNKLEELNVYKEYIKGTRYVKSFYILATLKNCIYFGNFGRNKRYASQISFFTKEKIITSPERAFALPSSKNLYITLKEKDKIKKIKIKKDDCIKNFFEKVLHSLKSKNFKIFYKKLLYDATLRDKIKNN